MQISTVISLTGENSHAINIPAGQGSFSIGTLGMNSKKFDIVVDDRLPIRWEAFNDFFTPAGGNWPRLFRHYGNDYGFVKWSSSREIEDFYWHPSKNHRVDLSHAQIQRLAITTNTNNVEIVLGNKIDVLILNGNIEQTNVRSVKKMPDLILCPTTSKDDDTPYLIPNLEVFRKLTCLDVSVLPVGQPLDCRSLQQFKHVKHLELSGNLVNVECLKNLAELQSLAIRFAPNLEGFPPLSSWKNLQTLIAWNIEKTAGKRFRNEVKQIKQRELNASISKLRESSWFITEYGIPFCGWEDKNAKVATKAYKNSVKELKKAKTQREVKKSIMDFVGVFNNLLKMETVERENVATAVLQLICVPTITVDEQVAMQWFDEVRDF